MKFKSVTPAIPVHNIKKAVRFYEDKFGFKSIHQDNQIAVMGRDNVQIHLWVAGDKMWQLKRLLPLYRPVASGEESYLAGAYTCRIEVDDLDRIFDQMLQRGVLLDDQTIIEETTWHTREFATRDLHGNLLIFCETY